ncbi:MAG: tyrosine-type recombinase/integrase [Planctomycetales bacterium]|nr:tyrosine-type recombinase/integrase [Planctomycetales bacterium]
MRFMLTEPKSEVFQVPDGLLRIMNRDLQAAGIAKRDESGGVIHVHALRHSFGTHLSNAGVAPRVAQGLMRHSRIELTMGTYVDARLLDTAGAVESLRVLTNSPPTVAPATVNKGQKNSITDQIGTVSKSATETKKPHNSLGITGFSKVEDNGLEPMTSTMPL